MHTGQRFAVGDRESFIADQFFIEVLLDSKDENGWPKVYDVAKRHRSVAVRHRITVADLHFYADSRACLGLAYPWDPPFTLREFLIALVQPFSTG